MAPKKRILLNLPNADRLSTRRLIGGILGEVELHPDLQTLILPYFSDRMRERIESGAFAGMITEGGYPDGRPGVVTGQQSTLRGQFIQFRRIKRGLTRRRPRILMGNPQIPVTQIVGEDEDNVGLLGGYDSEPAEEQQQRTNECRGAAFGVRERGTSCRFRGRTE